MEKIKTNKPRKGHSLIKILGMTLLAFLMLVSITGAAPYAYITNLNSNTVSVIDIPTNTVIKTVIVGYGPQGIAVTPDGSKVYVTNSGYGYQHPESSVSVIDTATNTVIKTLTAGHEPKRVAVSTDGTKVYVVNFESGGSVSVIDTATDTVTATVNGLFYPLGIAVNPDGTKVYVTSHNTVNIINTITNTVTATINDGSGPAEIAVNPEGTKIYVAHPGKNFVSVIDIKTSTVTDTILYNTDIGSPYGITVNPAGTNVYVTHHSSNTVSVTDTATNTVKTTVSVGLQPEAVAVSPDGTKVYVTNSHSNTVSVIDTATNTVTATVDVGNFPFGVVFTTQSFKPIMPTITWSNPADITYGAALNPTQLNAVAKDPVTGDTVPGYLIYTPASGTVLNAGTQTLKVDFTPQDTANYNSVSKDVTINVLKATSTITWNNPANITYGTSLSSIQLDAVAKDSVNGVTIDGTFTYNPTSGTILSIGNAQNLHVDFTPSDPTTYNTASADVQINILTPPLKTPTVAWSNPADITYGTALGDAQFNAVAMWNGSTVPGNFTYNPQAGTILSAGIHTLKVDFTPTDAANYNTTSKDVTINVLKATPTITWNNPVDIIYGTAFGDAQLDATCSVPGTFTYTPKAGTVLNAGTQTLHVDFTPTDTANYNTASTSVQINVITPVQDILQIVTMVQNLNLNQGQANSLVVKLNAATKKLNDGNKQAATNELDAFINEVEAYIKSGKLTSTEGQALIDDANNVINAINNVLDHPATSVPEFPSIALPVAAVLGLMVIVARKKQ